MQAAVAGRFNIMGQLDIAERRLPQDGRVSVKFDGEPIDLRIAVCRRCMASRSSSVSLIAATSARRSPTSA